MPTTSAQIAFPEFRAHAYPYDTLDLDQMVTCRILSHLPLEGTETPASSSSSDSGDPSPSSASTQEPTSLSTSLSNTPPTKPSFKLVKIHEYLSKRLLKALQSCKIFRSCFPVSELSDLDSATARMLHAHWEDRPPPPQHCTYKVAERRPRLIWMPRARRRFAGDTTGRPIWVLEAEAVEQGRL